MNGIIQVCEMLAGIIMVASGVVYLAAGRQQRWTRLGRVLFFAALVLFVSTRLALPWFLTEAHVGVIKPLSIPALFSLLLALLALFGLPANAAFQVWGPLALLSGLGWLMGPFGPVLAASPDKKVPLMWFYPHVIVAMMGVAASSVSAVAALLFLVQNRALKTGNLKLANRLPRITVLGRLLSQSIKAGALFYSTGLVLGSALAVYVWGKHFNGDPIEIGSVVGWLGQMILYVGTVRFGWADKRLAFGTLTVYLFWILMIGLTARVLPGAHRFG